MILIPWAASAEQVRQREHELRAVAEQRRRTHPRRPERLRHDHRVRERLARLRPGSV